MGGLTRRDFLKAGGAVVGALGTAGLRLDAIRAAAAVGVGPPVRLLLDGAPAATGTYAFPTEVGTVVLDNGLARFTFSRDDAAGGVVTGWPDVSITATSVIVNDTELAHNLNGIAPRDPDRQHSFYIDASGGQTRLVCSQIKVLRTSVDLAEVAFVDTTSSPLRHEHHLIMRRGRRGLYGYDIVTNVSATPIAINEIRMNTRWDRSIFDHAFNWERGGGQQPTYAYLLTQTQVQDETWRIDGINNPNLPSPGSNSGNLAPGTVYTKYNWTLYHRENPMFGHYGNGFGAWFTALGGVTDQTLGAFFGVGPNHQDLAIHQDALILDYFGANHYGLPSYTIQPGYTRLYGPWLTYLTAADPGDDQTLISQAAAIAQTEIAANLSGSDWVSDPLYPAPGRRSTVQGRLRIADGRSAEGFWAVLSTQTATDVYTIHEPTYFVKTAADGSFSLPGIPPAWQPGTTLPGAYTLYLFAAQGSVIDQYTQPGITVQGGVEDLGTITWAPTDRSTFLWQIGGADRMGGEFALATYPPDRSNPRAYEKPSQVPGDLTYTVGSSWEPDDWYYAQTNGGTWTVQFDAPRLYSGTAYLTVSSSMQQGHPPTVALNGSPATGTLPANNDSTIARQADRSGYPRVATLTFPASAIVVGANALTFTRGAGAPAGNGIGWDTVVLEVDEPAGPPPAQLSGKVSMSGPPTARTWTVQVTNTGTGDAYDLRLDSIVFTPLSGPAASPPIIGRDPNRFPVPVIDRLAPGGTATAQVTADLPAVARFEVTLAFSANGGRASGTVTTSA